MNIKQVRVAQALRGETSNILESKKYEMNFEKGILYLKLKHNPKGLGTFMVFPANIAWIEYEETTHQGEELAPAPSEAAPEGAKRPGRPAKK